MAMLPQEYVDILRISIRFGSVFAGHPYLWQKTANGPSIASKRRRLISCANCFLLGCYNLYLAVQTVRLVRSGDTGTVDLVFLVNILLIYGYAFVMLLMLHRRKRDYVAFLKLYFDFMRSSGTVTTKNARLLKIGAKLSLATFVALVFNGFGMLAPSLFRPFQAESLGPVVANFLPFYRLQRAVMFIAHVHLAYICTGVYMLLGPLFFFVSVPYLTAIKELREPQKYGSKRAQEHRWLCRYKALQILGILFNHVYGFVMGGAKAVLSISVIFGIACALRVRGFQALPIAGIASDGGMAMTMAFDFLAEFHRNSDAILRAKKAKAVMKRRKYFHRVLYALEPLKFRMGRFYFVDKVMVLHFLEFLITSVMSTLLMMPAAP